MFRINYEIRIRNPYKELYNPSEVYKVYNYIRCKNIDLENISPGQIISINNNLEQVVLNKTNSGFFIAPGLYIPNALAKLNPYTININDQSYNLTFNVLDDNQDQILIGSIILPKISTLFQKNDLCRVIDNSSENIVYMNYLNILDINSVNGLYIFNENSTILYFAHNNDILDWLNKANKLFIHSISTAKKDIDISLYIRCYGGSPSFTIYDTLPKYNFVLTNLTTGDIIEKSIPQFHYEKLNTKHLYEFNITDSTMSNPLMVNNIAHNNLPIIINPNASIKYTINSVNNKKSPFPKFSEIYQPLIR